MKAAALLPVSLLFITAGHNHKKHAHTVKPIIGIIFFDDSGYGNVGAYLATEMNTPNTDELAKAGIRFTPQKIYHWSLDNKQKCTEKELESG